MNRGFPPLFAIAVFAGLHARASACAVCGIDPNSPFGNASNAVLWTLLGLVGFIFLSTSATAFYLWRRAKAEIPPHVQLVEKLNDKSDESED